MLRSLVVFTGLLALGGAGLTQSEIGGAAFDVADVHASPHGIRESGLYLHANRFELHGVTMLRLITTAYDVKDDKVFGGPNWLDTARFDVVAKSEQPVNLKTYRPMLQKLLAERFQLKVRSEEKPEPVFALVAAKRGLLKESADAGEPGCQRSVEDGAIAMTCHHVTMAYLAENLPRMAPNYFDRPVIDKTGLEKSYEANLRWTGRGQLGSGGVSLFDYLEKQLGIKVEAQSRPASSLVIEKVSETPTPNPPGTAEKLPPAVTEFEVAEIRPSRPDTKEDFRLQNGRLEAFGINLKDLIGFAYGLDDYMLPGAEKWLDTDRFDLIAKTDPSFTDGTLQAMLRTLLEERFHLKTYMAEQPVAVWALTAPKGKSKLKESAGEEHAGCKRTPKDGAFVYSCRNTTMAQLADKLPEVPGARPYLHEHPMVDLTGLKGSYDFDITWSPPARTSGQPRGPAEVGGEPQAPTGGLTIYEAIDKQLGLKLAVEKHAMPVVVIDRLDRTPSEN